MTELKIFISHSAKDDFAVTLRDTLYIRLKNDGFTPLMDKPDLHVGDEWRQELQHWMDACHAAIILFSNDALNSDWVFEEVSILNHRRFLGHGFDILPILLSPVTHKELDTSRFSAVAINEIQAAKDGEIDTVISEILQRLAPLKDIYAEGPLYKLEDLIGSMLRHINPKVLLNAAKKLDVDVDKWPLHVANILLTRELFKIDLATLPKAISALEILAPYLNAGCGHKMVAILTSLWVNELAVQLIPQVIMRPPAQRVIRINGRRLDTGKMYILRASRKIPSWTVLRVTNSSWSEQQFEELLNEIRAAYAQEIGSESDDPDVESELLNPLEDDPLFVAIANNLDADILTKLREKYPRITFFLITEDIPFNFDELKRHFIEFLRPELQPGTEEEAHRLYRKAKRIVAASN